jgi:hypothetical protein
MIVKSALKAMSTAIVRGLAYYRMRSIEITLQGAVDTLPNVRCTETRLRMQLAIRGMRRDLCAARAHYTSLLPAGQRRVWDLA